MKIIRHINNNYSHLFTESKLGYLVLDDSLMFIYEFELTSNKEAIITFSDEKYILEVIDEFRKLFFNITTFYDIDARIIKKYEDVEIFKVNIFDIQVSRPYINKNKLDNIDISNYKFINFAVTTVNDALVLLNGHTLLYALYLENIRYVNIYNVCNKENENILDFLYLTKEMNINNISEVIELSNEEYEANWEEFYKFYNVSR